MTLKNSLADLADSYDHYRRVVGCGRREAVRRAWRYERGLSGADPSYPATCPYCWFVADSVFEETDHMKTAHPGVVDRRLRAAGIRP